MIAALLAALMGGMASVFNSTSTLVTLDFYKKLRPDASEKQLVLIGRVATGLMVVLGIAWVPFISRISGQLYIYLQSVQGYISPPIAACFILGILWPRLNAQGAISSLLTGFVLGTVRFVLELTAPGRGRCSRQRLQGLIAMNFLHYAIVMFVACCAVLIGVSMVTPAPDRKKLAGLTFATVDDKMDVVPVTGKYKPAAATAREHRLNVVFSVVLVLTILLLYINSGRPMTRYSSFAAQRNSRRSGAAIFRRPVRPLRSLRSGPLRSVADFYIPFRVFEVEINNAGKKDRRILGLDSVTGSLDPYYFETPAVSAQKSKN